MSVIAISRGSLSAAAQLAEGLRTILGGRIVTREQVVKAAEGYGLQEAGLSEKHIMAQHPPGFWERYSDARKHYLICFKAALLDFVLKESIIYHGNLAHLLLNQVPFVLRVRVNAPLENRIKVLMDAEGISEDTAIQKVREIDQQRRRWTAFLYDADYRDPILFDIVLNMEKMTIQDAIELVTSEAKRDQFQPGEESLKIVKDCHLATVAQAFLMHSPNTYGLDLAVDANAATGEVVVHKSPALAESAALDNDIRAALVNVEAVRTVEIDVAS
jgi:cytidylate kinase